MPIELRFLTFKIAQALQMTPGRVSVICDDKVWTEPEIQLKGFWKEGCTLTMLETPAWGVAPRPHFGIKVSFEHYSKAALQRPTEVLIRLDDLRTSTGENL